MITKQELIKHCLEVGILINVDILNKLNTTDYPSFAQAIQPIIDQKQLSEEILIKTLEQHTITLDNPVKIVYTYVGEPKKRTVPDFVSYFNERYREISAMLMNRQELQGAVAIKHVLTKAPRDVVSTIGVVLSKQETKNGNIILSLEDMTGIIKVIVSKNKPEVYNEVKDMQLDEVIGVVGNMGDAVIFANSVIWPDIPNSKMLMRSPEEGYAVFLSDIHVGSKHFYKKEFENMINWLAGLYGTDEQKAIAKKVKYIFLVGDLVEGVGIYPNQENDLDIPDIYGQYEQFATYLKRVPTSKKVIICAGNHDAMRIAEPQPPLYKDFAAALWELPNVVMVSNPAIVNIDASDKFPGLNVLMYHGYSLPFYCDVVESIRAAGGQTRVDLALHYLLKRRHLAPMHTSTLYLPDNDKDHLVISQVPDIFATGHIHRTSVTSYKNVTCINGSSWLRTTDFQEKMGLQPRPGRLILHDLKTRKAKVMKFVEDDQ